MGAKVTEKDCKGPRMAFQSTKMDAYLLTTLGKYIAALLGPLEFEIGGHSALVSDELRAGIRKQSEQKTTNTSKNKHQLLRRQVNAHNNKHKNIQTRPYMLHLLISSWYPAGKW